MRRSADGVVEWEEALTTPVAKSGIKTAAITIKITIDTNRAILNREQDRDRGAGFSGPGPGRRVTLTVAQVDIDSIRLHIFNCVRFKRAFTPS